MSLYLHVDACPDIPFPHKHPLKPATSDLYVCEGLAAASRWAWFKDRSAELTGMFDGALVASVGIVLLRHADVAAKPSFLTTFCNLIGAMLSVFGTCMFIHNFGAMRDVSKYNEEDLE